MKHVKAFRKFSRTPAHRRAMFRNLATNLVIHNRIETTLPKAKELKRVADKLVTLGKKNTLHARRQAAAYLFAINRTSQKTQDNKTKLTAVHKLFEEIAPRYTERSGGYTRVVKSRIRQGDRAQMAFIEFVEEELKAKEPSRRKRRIKKSDTSSVEESSSTGEQASEESTQEQES